MTNKFFYFFLAITLLIRICFTSFVGLIDDEAYHWSWTHELMLSYFDHPGLIAWLEKISTSWLGSTLWGVRLPSYLCYHIALYFFYLLGRDLFSEKAAQVATLLFLWSPFYGFGGYVASPEAPFIMFWLMGSWVFWQGVRPDSFRWSNKKTWLLLGLIMGLGLNSKFIMALLAPAMGLYLLATSHRKVLLTRWPWIGVLVATLVCLPVFIWNYEFEWPGFYYQFYDRHTGNSFSITRWLGWFSAQFLFYTPVVFGLFIYALKFSVENWKQARFRFLICMTLPSLVIFYPQPLWADYKPHWPGAAHLYLLMAVGYFLTSETLGFKKWLKNGILFFYILINVLVYTPFLGPWMPALHAALKIETPWDSRWDLSNEFHGWQELGDKVNELQKNYHRDFGLKPFIGALRYETTAQTFWGTQQKTFMLSPVTSHYTVVQRKRQTLLGFHGQPTLVVTTEKYPADPLKYGKWDSCTPEEFKTYRGAYLSRTFTIWTCLNFQGLHREK